MQSTGGKTRNWKGRRRWEDNIKIYLKEIGWDCVHCIACTGLRVLYCVHCIACTVLRALYCVHCIACTGLRALYCVHCIACTV
jgi:hypothetical protein